MTKVYFIYLLISILFPFIPISLSNHSKSFPIRVINLLSNRNTPLPEIPYCQGLKWQNNIMDTYLLQERAHRDTNTIPECVGTLLLLQHRSVYTLGSSSQPEGGPNQQILSVDGKPSEYEVVNVERGGQVTYHGPGQLVCYPILDLNYFGKDIHDYLRKLEQSIIFALLNYDISAHTIPGLTGVWYNNQKLAAIGIKISRWVTLHGLSINISPDMRYFENIIPCGIVDKKVGMIASYRSEATMNSVAKDFITAFCKVFDAHVIETIENENDKENDNVEYENTAIHYLESLK